MLMKILSSGRYLMIIPVVGCVIISAGVMLMGVGRMFVGGWAYLAAGDLSPKATKAMSLAVIEIIDLFLIGTVSFITAVGLYKLFISSADIQMPMRLQINSVKDLEDKIIGVLVAALAVAFVGHAAGGDEPRELLNYGGGIALVIFALGFFSNFGGKKEKPKKDAS